MATSRSALQGAICTGVVLTSALSLLALGPAGCAGGPEYRIVGNTYISETYNCRISVPNDDWIIEPANKHYTGAVIFVYLRQLTYNSAVAVAVAKKPQANLEAFASMGAYNPRLAKFTYVAGKPCYYGTRPMVGGQGSNLTSQLYKLANNNTGYILSVGFPTAWSEHEKLQMEIDDILNSFEFASLPAAETATDQTPEIVTAGKSRLSNVAILDMVDLTTGEPSQATRVLTDELQNQCARTKRFKLIERRNLRSILDEHDLQLSGMISGSSVVRTGKLLKADYLISGNLGRMGSTGVVYVQVADSSNGKIIATASMRRKRASDDRLLGMMPDLVVKLVYRLEAQQAFDADGQPEKTPERETPGG